MIQRNVDKEDSTNNDNGFKNVCKLILSLYSLYMMLCMLQITRSRRCFSQQC